MSESLIIYHANCTDGFGAAYAAFVHFNRQGQTCGFYPGKHGEPPPDCSGKKVYIVDFSYHRPVLSALCESAEQVTIIDHHISAQEDLSGLDKEHNNLEIVFNMDKSGAVLSWEYFHKEAVPDLLRYVQDRDLWRFALPDSKDISAALMARPDSFEEWDSMVKQGTKMIAVLKEEGQAINRYRRQLIFRYKQKAVTGSIGGYEVPVVNCPVSIASEVLGELAQDHPFAAGYEDRGDKRGWSLRSRRNGGVNVARIAQQYGGGGHHNAAGFSTPLPPELLSPQPSV